MLIKVVIKKKIFININFYFYLKIGSIYNILSIEFDDVV